MSLIWQPATPIQMLVEEKAPIAFIWQGRRHQVRLIAKSWRLDWGWWRLRLWRDYYKLLTESQLLVLVYQDLQSGDWFLQQIYD
jgi:hypothetical protein